MTKQTPSFRGDVEIAAGAVMLVFGGIAMKLMNFPLDWWFGLRLGMFFLLGAGFTIVWKKIQD
jgi:hypothetical protein